jgi:Mce-associated membrane protein
MADRRRNRSANRPPADSAPPSGEITVDGETAKALALFNTRLSQQAEADRAQRRIDRATRTNDQAAAQVRTLESDPKATAEQRAAAATAYHQAVDTLARAKRGEPEPTADPEPEPSAEPEGELAPEAELDAESVSDPVG